MPDRSRIVGLVALAIALAGCTAPDDAASTRGASSSLPTPGLEPGAAAPAVPSTVHLLEFAVVPDTADLGDAVVARAVAKNTGAAPETFTVEFRLGDDLVATSTVTLTAGESTLVAGKLTPGRAGNHSVEARVRDTTDALTSSVLIHGPDLKDPAVQVLDLQQCDRVAYRVSFKNAGTGAAQGVTVEAQLRNTDGGIVDTLTQDIGDLAAGSPTLLEFTHVAPARCTALTHTYTVHVLVQSAGGVVLEHDSAPFTV